MTALPVVVHRVPGRARLRLPRRLLSPHMQAGISAALDAHGDVVSYRLNPAARSLVVEFRPGLDLDELRRELAAAPPAEPRQAPPRPQRPRPLNLLPVAAGGLFALTGQPLAAPLLALGALPIARRAAERLIRQRKVSVDLLDSAAIALTLGGGQPVTAALTIGLIEGGEWLREMTAARSRRALGALMSHPEAKAWKLTAEGRLRVRVGELQTSDVVALTGGDRVPVDGTVVRGRASVDERLLSGEPLPLLKEPGDHVFAMTIVTEGEVEVRADAPASESRAGRIMAFLEQAPIGETRMADHARRIADRFVLPVMALAGGVYALTGSPSRAASLLIFDLATGIRVAAPTTMLAALMAGAREGILIKGAGALERLAHVDCVVFDKTGTLTSGRPRLESVERLDGLAPAELLALAAAADEGVAHPLAKAVVRQARNEHLNLPRRLRRRYHIGLGMEARIEEHGECLVGNRRLLESRAVPLPAAAERFESIAGVTPVYVAAEGRCLGAILLRDQLRDEAASVMRALHERGVRRVVILSGDGESATGRLARELGVDEWLSRMRPEDKAEEVRRLRSAGHTVAVIGDGVNDSLAMSEADVPIGMGKGAHVAQATADVVLLEDRLELLPRALDRARGALQLMNQNLALIAAPNAVGLAAAVAAPMNPALAALLNNGSTVVAAGNGLRPLLSARMPRP